MQENHAASFCRASVFVKTTPDKLLDKKVMLKGSCVRQTFGSVLSTHYLFLDSERWHPRLLVSQQRCLRFAFLLIHKIKENRPHNKQN